MNPVIHRCDWHTRTGNPCSHGASYVVRDVRLSKVLPAGSYLCSQHLNSLSLRFPRLDVEPLSATS